MLSLVAPINHLSYGIVSENILIELLNLGVQVSLYPIGYPEPNSELGLKAVQKSINNLDSRKTDPSIRIFHQFDLMLHAGSPRIGFPIFELDTFSKLEMNNILNQDKILVCSSWAKDVVLNHVNIPCDVVPLGVSSDFKPIQKRNIQVMNFLNIGKYEVRKGHDILPMLFNKAFPTEKDVKLTIVPHSPFFSPDEEDAWNSLFTNNLGNRVRILPKLTKEALIDVMAQADCGIFPTRAEGWGMPILEMMAMGKNVIVNNYSGITEYCNTSNSILIDPIGKEPAIDNKWFNGFGSWSKIDENSFILAMRDCYERWKKGELKDNQEGIKTAQKFNWKNSAHKLLNSLAKG